MMSEQAIVHSQRITRIGERVSFQVRLPKDTQQIIGLEYWARKISGVEMIADSDRRLAPEEGDLSFEYSADKLIGKLSLQISGCPGLFYQGNLIEPRNPGYLEALTTVHLTGQDWIQSTKREEISFAVPGFLIEGYFEDSYGTDEYQSLQYELTLYFWIKKSNP